MMTRLAGPAIALGGAFGFYELAKGAIQFDQADAVRERDPETVETQFRRLSSR